MLGGRNRKPGHFTFRTAAWLVRMPQLFVTVTE
jgi:hypothetical protein